MIKNFRNEKCIDLEYKKEENMKPELANIKISQPAYRALTNAGIKSLDQLTQYRETELLALHGFGPKALGILKSILEEYGLSFKVEEVL